jgi:ribosomal protein S18 acetylase RimI-like enzyme
MATIRKGRTGDVERLVELWKELIDHHRDFDRGYSNFVPDVEEVQAKFYGKVIRSRRSVMLVAEDDGAIVGFLFGSIASRPPVFKIQKHAFIGDLLVSRKYRRKGIGKMLVDGFESWGKEREAKFMTIAVYPENREGMAFWEEIGFLDNSSIIKRKFF